MTRISKFITAALTMSVLATAGSFSIVQPAEADLVIVYVKYCDEDGNCRNKKAKEHLHRNRTVTMTSQNAIVTDSRPQSRADLIQKSKGN